MWDLKSPLPQAGGCGGGGGDLPIAVVGGQAWSGRVEGSRAEAGEESQRMGLSGSQEFDLTRALWDGGGGTTDDVKQG